MLPEGLSGPRGVPKQSTAALKAEARSNGEYKHREETGGARGDFDPYALRDNASYASQVVRTFCESAVLTPIGVSAHTRYWAGVVGVVVFASGVVVFVRKTRITPASVETFLG